eukprot:TRINITY_DN16001_c0_g1_i2.p1 TRINITY_DN16001_c0_g1~~TRINITY_DN16001_c0_g1_i2.p1  ORF type:complete len:302 (-),score=20.08 TRINITY_DN16001_c0_g1_i2:1090-1995(-)
MWRMPHLWYQHSINVPGFKTSVDIFYIDTTVWIGSADTVAFLRRDPADVKMEQVKWLEDSLSSSKAAWKVVVGHHPLLSLGPHRSTAFAKMNDLNAMLQKYGVAIYVNGHNHNQQVVQYDSITYVTSGNGAKRSCEYRAHAPSKSVKFVDCRGGFIALSVHDRDHARLDVHGQRGEVLAVFDLRNAQSRRSPSTATRNRKNHTDATCFGAAMQRVDMECTREDCGGDDCCTVLADMTWGEFCASYCGSHGLHCAESFWQDEVAGICAVKNAFVSCEQKSDISTKSLICRCTSGQQVSRETM